ncbi:D-allose transport system permease protein AlsC [Nonomuraea coxensis DSM 45129]|uniref:D-allose transport system permease protein AlsC n=1 Tax=Nonomuraea coxensis DSM 45129 TaxID=1122611 RepID=A0ABX8UC28_9ACTN|nr:ABC transporter permease [Nonomuraea coxensis]QYC44278.1 D-allose transport system permease protein AlsC [Nonomuraea coxensis DSM 45129]
MTVSSPAATPVRPRNLMISLAARAFVKIGVLPVLVLVALVVFASMSDSFLTVENIHSALRQNSYIVIATLGQFIVLLTGGFDLSIGAVTALVSVSSAMAMVAQGETSSPLTAVLVGIGVGLLVGMGCGLVNALGIATLNINPFIMTLATASAFSGLALMLTSGVPVAGLPVEFSDWLGFNKILGIGVPIWIAALAAVGLWVLLTLTRPGRHIYSVGSSPKAAKLSGISEFRTLLLAYVAAGGLAAIGAVLLTARIETGEANLGASLPLQTIAAAVIGGVSLRGGSGRVTDAVLGAVFIGIVANGMNLAQINSYYQMIVTGTVLALAVVADRLRNRLAVAVYAGKV